MVVLSKGLVFPGGVFFTGSPTANAALVPALWPVAIAGHPYNIEPRLCRRTFTAIQRPAQDQTAEPGEASLSPEGLWRRSQSDWSLGTGQVWLDEEDSTRRQFSFSLGLEVFGDREISMLPATEEKRSSANTNLRIERVDDRFYVVDGANLVFGGAGANDEQDATWPTTTTGGWTVATGLPGGNILDFAYSGSHVYVLGSDNSIYRAATGVAAFTLFYNPTAVLTRIYAGLGRLFGSVGNQLYEITATPGETLIFTHPDPNYVFAHLCSAPTGVYFAGNIGTFGELRHTWVRDDGAAFVAPVVAADFINEPINVCETRGNVMLIGTRTGLRMALIAEATTGLSFGPPISELGNVRDIVFDTVGAETFAWITWSALFPGLSGLAKVRVSRQTEDLVPAYARDIYAVSGGTVMAVASISGRRYFAVASDGFFGATANKVPTATLVTGRIRYGLLATKVFATLQWRTGPLKGAVAATAVLDDGSTVSITNQGTPASLGVGPVRMPDAVGEYIELTFTFDRDAVDPTQGPTFRWWLMRSLVTPEGTQKFVVALRLENPTQPPHGPAQPVAVASETDFLAGLVGARQVVKYQRGNAAYDVYVVNFEERPEQWQLMDVDMEGLVLVEMDQVI